VKLTTFLSDQVLIVNQNIICFILLLIQDIKEILMLRTIRLHAL